LPWTAHHQRKVEDFAQVELFPHITPYFAEILGLISRSGYITSVLLKAAENRWNAAQMESTMKAITPPAIII
jgi:hypothetical protein